MQYSKCRILDALWLLNTVQWYFWLACFNKSFLLCIEACIKLSRVMVLEKSKGKYKYFKRSNTLLLTDVLPCLFLMPARFLHHKNEPLNTFCNNSNIISKYSVSFVATSKKHDEAFFVFFYSLKAITQIVIAISDLYFWSLVSFSLKRSFKANKLAQ